MIILHLKLLINILSARQSFEKPSNCCSVEGSVTCHGDEVKNANCPKDQYMVVKFASYRGLLAPWKCGLSDDYSCKVDVTCLVKKRCDGLHECRITVDDNLFSDDLCSGLSNYLYFLYQCIDTVKPHKEPCGKSGHKHSSINGNQRFLKQTFLEY